MQDTSKQPPQTSLEPKGEEPITSSEEKERRPTEKLPPKPYFVYPLTHGFGFDDSPPPISLAGVDLEHPIFDKGPRGAGPFEAKAQANEDER